MLDVHPPHHPTHTWSDFFIHIATIVVGLLIAVGLEQTVEYLHHRHLGHEATVALEAERGTDEACNNMNIYTTIRHQHDLQRDLAILHAVRDHSERPEGPFMLNRLRCLYAEGSWQAANQTGVIAYVGGNHGPTAYRYKNQDQYLELVAESIKMLTRAGGVLRTDHDLLDKTYEANVAYSTFYKKLADSKETLSEEEVQRGFAPLAEHGDLTRLTPAQLDELERAIQTALVDDDALLASLYNIKRNLHNNP